MIENLHQLYKSLWRNKSFIHNITSNIDRHYRLKVKPKMKFGRPQVGESESIKVRHLAEPVQSLKFIQAQICNLLQQRELPDCMYGSVGKRSNILNALQHVNGKYFLTIDLKSFFTNISNTKVHQVFIDNGCSWEVARILTKLTTYRGSLPQGAPSSPILANLAFAATAKQIQEFIRPYDITFTTFLDDLTFSSKNDFKNIVTDILEIIRSNHFYPHPKKIFYRSYSCEVTGLIVGNGKLKLASEMRQEAQKNIYVNRYARLVKRTYLESLASKASMDPGVQ